MIRITLAEQIACVRREIGMRESLYPRWVLAGKMAQHKAEQQIAEMRAVLATLEALDAEQHPGLFPQ